MKLSNILVFALIGLSMLSFGQDMKCAVEAANTETYVENEFIVWLEPGVDAAEFAARSQVGLLPERLLSKRLNIWLFEIVDKTESREAKMDRLEKDPDVRLVQNNHTTIRLRETIPDDPGFSRQWAPIVMQLPIAWEVFTTGGITATGDTIVVAVIDAGMNLDHEDLVLWKNRREIPNNGIDDDANGYVDDYDGWDVFSHSGLISSDFHGTHVAGIIGAVGDNGTGICGVNWNVKVMPVVGSSSNESSVVEAYAYVLEMRARYNETHGAQGAFVVATNSSFGVDYGNPNDYPIWCSMYDEMGNVGILSCTAGPNNNVNVDEVGDIPSTCPGNYLIGITNTTSSDVKYSDAGYGIANIDIGAPGTDIFSTLPGGYGTMTGTSMATPHVTGTIALMYAAMTEAMMQSCKNDPASFCLTVRESLLDGSDHLPSLDGLVASGRRLNALGAIDRLFGNPETPVLTGTVRIVGKATFGQTLSLQTNLSSVPAFNDLGGLSYQWRRGTTLINGATNPTYTLKEQDLDQLISVQVKAANCDGAVVSESVGPVAKAEQQRPQAPQLEKRTGNSITLVRLQGCEYNINGGEWRDSPTFEGLSPQTSYAFAQRKKETNTHFASPASSEAVFSTTSNNGIEESDVASFKVYPNPTTGFVTIEGTGHITVTNILGQTIQELDLVGQTTMELPKGVFFIKNNAAMKKVVVE